MRHSERIADEFVNLVVQKVRDAPLTYDMGQVGFLYPYGVMLLLSTARHVARATGSRVELTNLQPQIGAYLERVDLFTQGEQWLYVSEDLQERFFRNDQSYNLVEICRLQTPRQQAQFLNRTRSVMETWLHNDEQEIDRIFSVLSEICSNAREHSQDEGQAMVQHYRWHTHAEVHIAVTDLGIGINGSLSRQYGAIAPSAERFILLALAGRSARGEQEGGAGLQMVKAHIAQQGGELAIRSDTGFVMVKDDGEPFACQLPALPGTQVSVKLRSR